MALNLNEILSVFATCKVDRSPSIERHHFSFYKLDKPNKPNKHAKHLKLLNDIALLLVTEASDDVAAVCITNHARTNGRTITRIHIMKNRSCTNEELEYFNEFVGVLNQCEASKILEALCNIVPKNCRQQIIARFVKLQKVVEAVKDRIPTWAEPKKDDLDDFRQFYKSSTSDSSWSQSLLDFPTKELCPSSFSSKELCQSLIQAYLFVKNNGLLNSLRSTELVEQLKNVSDYIAIMQRMKELAIRERGRRVFELNILPSPPRITLPPIPSPIVLINQCVRAIELLTDEFTPKDLQDILPTIQESDIHSDRPSQEAFVHCECALAVEMRKLTNEPSKIGVSEDSCWPCARFLKEFSSQSGKIGQRPCHGKTDPNWLFPLDVSHPLYKKVECIAIAAFESWVMDLHDERTGRGEFEELVQRVLAME